MAVTRPRITRLFAASSGLYLLAWLGAALADALSPGAVPWRAQLHLALFGFAGMMIFGMSYLFVPNFSGRMLARTDWAVAHLALAHAGVAGGAAALAAGSPADWVFMALWLAGGGLWTANLLATLKGPRLEVLEKGLIPLEDAAESPRKRVDRWARVATAVVPIYLLAASAGFVASYAGVLAYPVPLHLYTTGFIALMIFGAGYHLLPRFTGVVPPPRFVALNVGLGAAGPALVGLSIGSPSGLFRGAALLEATAGLLFAGFVIGSLLKTGRRHPAYLFYAASAVCLAAGVLLGLLFAVDYRWRIYTPVHAWVNLLGFAGLMIVGVSIDALIGYRRSDSRDRLSFTAIFLSAVAGLGMVAASYGGTPTRTAGLLLLLFAALLYAARLLAKFREIGEAERRLAASRKPGPGGESMSDEPKCYLCGAPESRTLLLQARRQGKTVWVCPAEMPRLIHGGG